MKRLFLILFVISSLNLDAQYITNHAKNVKQAETDGVYYYLPRNIIRLDFIVEKTQDFKGKYCAFAKELLNTDNFIKENKTTYRITEVNITSLTEADPNMIFHVATDDKTKDNPKYDICLDSDGIIKSFGCQIVDDNYCLDGGIKDVMMNEIKVSDYLYIPLGDEEDELELDDEVEVETSKTNTKLTDKEIAQTIIEEIKKLRLAYVDLISGYQEVNYGETIVYMLNEMKALENEYLSMFVGKTESKSFRKTFYVIPEAGKTSVVLTKFSDTEGFNTKIGESVKINFTDISTNQAIDRLTIDHIENQTHNNKMFYRNPVNVTMQINLGDKVISENRLKISQFGNVILMPMNKMKLMFDTNTGQILSLIKE